MKSSIVITTHALGSDNTLFFEYNRHTWQGQRRIRYWAEYLATRQGLPVSVYTRHEWQNDGKPFMTLGVN